MTVEATAGRPNIISTGVAGLDDVLCGGLADQRLYLLEGEPGSGKTTLALQFLLAGTKRGERCMFVTLSETAQELNASAASHGWSLEGTHVLELVPPETEGKPDARYTMFHPSEVELSETIRTVFAEAERAKPSRIVFESLSELRLLAEHPLRYRRQILALKQRFAHAGSTVLFIDDRTSGAGDRQLHSLAHGVVSLERDTAEYGTIRRRVQVSKVRGRSFREGYHDFVIRRGGLEVFPRLVATEHARGYARELLPSGVKELDTLLGGGLARGTSTLVTGAAGTGKSTLATQYALAAVARGQHASIFMFDEAIATFIERSTGLGLPVASAVESGKLRLRQVDPAELSPGEFAFLVRRAAESDRNGVVVIDSLSGYFNAMPSEHFLTLHLHELLTYLGQLGVTTLLLMTQHGIIAPEGRGPIDASYLADTVILIRYFEARGEVRQAISVIKKRTGPHERTIRELTLAHGVKVGDPLRNFQGVLSGMPEILTGARAGAADPDR